MYLLIINNIYLANMIDINKRLPGDFKDLLKSIKKGSPGCNMDNY